MSRVAIWSVLSAVALAGCFPDGDGAPDDVTGPYSGPIRRYVVDGFTLPTSSTTAREMADDLDGDRSPDNQLGMTFGSLASFKNLTTHAPDMIASNVLASIVQIQADDLAADGTARVWFYGAEGEEAEAVGGTIANGAFVSNRTRTTRVPGRARVHLPVFVDIDPVAFDLHGMEIDLTPDGKGGFDGIIRGAVREEEAKQVAYDGILDMFAARPQDHRLFWFIVEKDFDGVVTYEELSRKGGLLAAMLAADVEIRTREGVKEPMLSLAFRVHLSPCEAGRCRVNGGTDQCRNRILDVGVGETDIDCGGSCGACPGGDRCLVAADCQTGTCTAAGTCALPTCSDGVQDGFEADVDCGGGCAPCGAGKTCDLDVDCLSGQCDFDTDRCF
jgi:hypothetical protein